MTDYKTLFELFSDHLGKHISGLNNKSPRELYDPEHYILSLGGKRLRPLLALIACDLFDKEPQLALDSAMAVELFHNFSLIHDDILDAAPLRRNKETVHTKWNTNIAILSGDAILVKSFQILGNHEASMFKHLSSLFCKTAIEVCEGQQLDMNFEKSHTVSAADYIHMITHKTAVLLGCSLKMGAINAGASASDQEHLYEFGKHLGISFQLLDDFLDAFSEDAEKFGKQIGGDILANKKTFLLLKAFELCDKKQLETLHASLQLKNEKEKIKTVVSLFESLGVKEQCKIEADKHTQLAIEHLGKIQASETKKEKLKEFALQLLNREL